MHYTSQKPLQFEWGSGNEGYAQYVNLKKNLCCFFFNLLSLLRWCNGEPNNFGDKSKVVEGCAQLVGGCYNDNSCSTTRISFLCEQNSD